MVSCPSLALHIQIRIPTFYLRPFLTDLTCAQDQTANIAAALALAPVGTEIIAPPGCILTAGTTTITSRVLRGVGPGGTEWRYAASSGAAIKLMGDNTRVSGVWFTTTASSPANVAVQLADGFTNPINMQVDHIRAEGFRDQIDVQSGQYWRITNFYLSNAARYGVRVRNSFNVDNGDSVISQGTIFGGSSPGTAGLRYETGGGLKVNATKILHFARGVDLSIPDGAVTVDFLIAPDVSIENQADVGVRVGRASGGTTGVFSNIHILAQIGFQPAGVVIEEGVSNVTVGGTFSSMQYAIQINGGDNINVQPGIPMSDITAAGIVVADPARRVRIGSPLCKNCATDIVDNRSTGGGGITPEYSRPLSLAAPNDSSAYATLYQVAVPPYRGNRITVQAEGLLQGQGAINRMYVTQATNNGSAVAMSSAPITDQKDGIDGIDLQFDTSSIAGSVVIGARVKAAYPASSFSGSLTLRIDGKISFIKQL